MKDWLKPPTYLWMIAALGAAFAVHTERDRDTAPGGFVSTRSSARRVFPTLAEADPNLATIVLRPSSGSDVTLEPAADGGHQLRVGTQVVGPADPRAVDGLWASLRMATTLRAVAQDVEIGVAREGSIAVSVGGVTSTAVVGGATSDGAGLLGIVDGPGFEGEEGWVLEAELGEILGQAPQAWLARRVRLEEPADIARMTFSDGATLARGEDGRWRSTLAAEPGTPAVAALLSTDAVDARLGRLLGARMSPMLPEQDTAASTWMEATTTDGIAWALGRGGRCPDGSAREVVVRGAGWPGCVDSVLLRPWPLPGREEAAASSSMLEPALVPYGYGRVLRIEHTLPTRTALRRRSGDWILVSENADGGGRRETQREVEGTQVFEWYETLRAAEVEPLAEPLSAPVWTTAFTVTTDSTQQLRVRCGDSTDGLRVCQRDDGILLRLRTPEVALVPGAETFSDRTLVRMSREDIRSVEITGADTVRQSVHFDLGVWRLDAPAHPEGDLALSEVYLEDLLSGVAAVRVEAWSARPDVPAERVLRVELAVAAGGDSVTTLELWRDEGGGCRAAVDEAVGTLGAGTCRRLFTDLLHDDPVAAWLDTARSLEVHLPEASAVRFERSAEGWTTRSEDADAAADAMATLRRLAGVRSARIESLPEAKPSQGVGLSVLPKRGERFDAVVSLDSTWLWIEQSPGSPPWAYRLPASD